MKQYRLYRIRDGIGRQFVCYLRSEYPLDLRTLLERFRMDYGFYDNKDHDDKLILMRLRIAADRHRLGLDADPLADGLCYIFADWCAKQVRGEAHCLLEPSPSSSHEEHVDEFVFRL